MAKMTNRTRNMIAKALGRDPGELAISYLRHNKELNPLLKREVPVFVFFYGDSPCSTEEMARKLPLGGTTRERAKAAQQISKEEVSGFTRATTDMFIVVTLTRNEYGTPIATGRYSCRIKQQHENEPPAMWYGMRLPRRSRAA